MKRIFIVLLGLALLAGCSPRPSTAENTYTQSIKQVLPGQGPIVTGDHGKELWFALTALLGVNGTNANGIAQGHFMEDGTSIYTIQLNIEKAPQGSYYEGWLMGADGSNGHSIGHFTAPFGDVRHQLSFTGKEDLRSLLKVAVTLEKDDGNPGASKHVAEATLKEVERE